MREPALFLHGGPGMSDYTGGLAEELAGRFEPVRHQQRGVAPGPLDGPFTVEQFAADAVAVLDECGLARAWLVGHSWGAHLAMHVAVTHPERVVGIVAVGALGALPDGGRAGLEAVLAARYRRLRGRELPPGASLADYWPCYFAAPERAPPMPPIEVVPEVFAAAMVSVAEHFTAGTLARALPGLDLPALFVHGREDPLPWRASAESASLIPAARLELLEGCGHFPWLERPGALAAAISHRFE